MPLPVCHCAPEQETSLQSHRQTCCFSPMRVICSAATPGRITILFWLFYFLEMLFRSESLTMEGLQGSLQALMEWRSIIRVILFIQSSRSLTWCNSYTAGGFLTERAASWMSVSGICFGPHEFIMYYFDFSFCSFESQVYWGKGRLQKETHMKSSQGDRFQCSTTLPNGIWSATDIGYFRHLSHHLITSLTTDTLACSPVACFRLYCSSKIQNWCYCFSYVFPFCAYFLHILFCVCCFSYALCLALSPCSRKKRQ